MLLRIFNNILQTGQYPIMWTQGAISPVHKKGSVDIPDNYRGITVTSSMCMLFGIMMNNRLTSFCSKHAIIDERQCSHKKGARTTDNVLIIKSLFEKYCEKDKGHLYTCFIDFKKAFDSIWHEGLFLKLLRHEIGGPFYKPLKSMYKKNSEVVKLNGTLTQEFPVKSVVRQGDIQSPLLFNIRSEERRVVK